MKYNLSEVRERGMNVLVAVNEEYLSPLSVMIYSLAVNNPTSIRVYVLHFEIADNVQLIFKKQIRKWKKDVEIEFCQVNKNIFRDIARSTRYRQEANLRLAMLEVLPKNMERILWLDTDIIVKGNILKLYNYPNHGQCAIVCRDMASKVEKYDILRELGMKPESRYFNSGVMLLYLNNIRNNISTGELIQWMRDNPDKLRYPDQNVLNVFMENKIVWAKPEIYNLQLLRVCSGKEKETLMRNAKIVHYNTKEKPWNADYDGLNSILFWKYGIFVLKPQYCMSNLSEKLKGYFRKKK